MGRRRIRAGLLAGLVSIVGFVVGFSTISLARNSGLGPAEDGQDSYVLSDFSITYPVEARAGDDIDYAMVEYAFAWTGSIYPGAAECRLEVFGADGAVVGSVEFQTIAPLPTSRPRVTLPVARRPVNASGFCAAGVKPTAGYAFSDLLVEDEGNVPRLYGSIAWANNQPPGLAACTATLTLKSGETRSVYFELSSGPVAGGVITLLPGEEFVGATPNAVACDPYTRPRPEDVPG